MIFKNSIFYESELKSDKKLDDSSRENKYHNGDESNIDVRDKRVVTSEISIKQVLNTLADKSGQSGATVVFAGSVRSTGKAGAVTEMYYEAYTRMAEKTIKEIEEMAMEKWDIKRIRIVHRIGWLKLGDLSVVIALSTLHSKEAFEACEKILAMIKQNVPIWKKELLSNGIERWVDGKPIFSNNGSPEESQYL